MQLKTRGIAGLPSQCIVLISSINRGGVLEAAGAASIKFREKDILSTAHRIDHALIALDEKVRMLKESKAGTGELEEVKIQISLREKMLFGVFQQVAVHFADLHDTPGRMRAKGVIRREVKWAASRTFFYWRLRRRLLEFSFAQKINGKLKPPVPRQDIIGKLLSWCSTHGLSTADFDDDKCFVEWCETNAAALQAHEDELRAASLAEQISSTLEAAGTQRVEVLRQAIAQLSESERTKLLSP